MGWNNAAGYIFDVDGTLYPQNRVRVHMGLRLLRYYILRPLHWKELTALYLFRKMREKVAYKAYSVPELCAVVHTRLHLSQAAVAAVIERWMMQAPLDLLKKYHYREVAAFLRTKHSEGAKIIFYSDYPAVNKLAAIDLPYDAVFVFGDAGIPEQKPCPHAMQTIQRHMETPPQRWLYVGDRHEKDGLSAKLIGVPYMDIQRFRHMLAREKR